MHLQEQMDTGRDHLDLMNLNCLREPSLSVRCVRLHNGVADLGLISLPTLLSSEKEIYLRALTGQLGAPYLELQASPIKGSWIQMPKGQTRSACSLRRETLEASRYSIVAMLFAQPVFHSPWVVRN